MLKKEQLTQKKKYINKLLYNYIKNRYKIQFFNIKNITAEKKETDIQYS